MFQERRKYTKFDCPKYFSVSAMTKHDKLKWYHVMTIDYILTARVTDFCSVVVRARDPYTRDLKSERQTCRSESGFYGFPRFVFSGVRPTKPTQNRPHPLLSAVLLCHFS